MLYFANAGQILIQFIFGALIGLFGLRVLLQLVRANFYNPVCQFVYKATNPLLTPLRKIIKPWRNLDIAGLLVCYLLSIIKGLLLTALIGFSLGLVGALVFGFAELIDSILTGFFLLILFRVILSFAGGQGQSPVVPLIYQLTEPVLRPIQRVLPAVGGFDFSPIIAMLAIYLARALLVQPLTDLAQHLA